MGAFHKFREINSILQHSIIKKLLVVAFSIYLVLTITVTIIHMKVEYDSSESQTISALHNLQIMIHDSVSQAIWEFNTTQLDTILKGLYTNQFLVGIRLQLTPNSAIPELTDREIGLVQNDAGTMLFYDPKSGQSSVVTNTLEQLIPDRFDIYHYDILGKKQMIGTMWLYSSNKVVFDQVETSFILIIVNAIIKTIGLWILFLWAGYLYISIPLMQLTNAIKRLATGDWVSGLKLAITKDRVKTEINTLFETFNDMIHKLHSTQEKLEVSKNRLDNIFNTMPSALISLDGNGIIKGWNRYIASETNIDAKNAINHKITEIYPAFKDYFHLVDESLKNQKEQQVNHAKLIRDKDSHKRLYNISVYPIPSPTDPEAVIRIDDVTEQVKNENELAQVEKLASVGALVAGVAHEINNPLGTILQSTQNIIRRLDPDLDANKKIADELHVELPAQYAYLQKRDIIQFLDGIREAGERASSIVKNMLKFTRRSTDEMGEHDLVELINDGVQLTATDFNLQQQVDFKQIQITKDFYNDHVLIHCHPMEIQQVILNLLKNAAHALGNKTGKKEITIKLYGIDQDKIGLEIADNGHGMSEEVKAKIFQPFFTTKPIGQGTGLGLSICRNIIMQKHHGQMEVESTENVGTKFIITLPITQTAS